MNKLIITLLTKTVVIMAIFIPIGSDCSIAHQLGKHNLRNAAYPFDHVKIKKLSSVNNIIKSDFLEYTDFTIIGDRTGYQFVRGDIDNIEKVNPDPNNHTTVLKNKYGIIFPHDYNKEDSGITINDVKEKYERRINRFRNINQPTIFIWYEQNKTKYEDVHEFENIINRIYPNLLWNLIIITKKKDIYINSSKVYIYLDDVPFLDWTKNNLDWPVIFGMRSKITMNKGQICSNAIHPIIANHFQTINRNATLVLDKHNRVYADNDIYIIDDDCGGYELTANHFSQSSIRVHNQIRNIVKNIIPTEVHYIGINGLSDYYGYHNRDKLLSINHYPRYPTPPQPTIRENTIILINDKKLNIDYITGVKYILFITCSKGYIPFIRDYDITFKESIIGIDTIITILFYELIIDEHSRADSDDS